VSSPSESAYSAASLPKKLGVVPGSRVVVDGAPDAFDLPGVAFHRRAGKGPYDVGLLFCHDYARLVSRWDALHRLVTPAGRLWVAWPKRASGLQTDLDDDLVRRHGLDHGRVDTKVCAIDATWSGLAFVVRLADR
jgi:hypothetical protein